MCVARFEPEGDLERRARDRHKDPAITSDELFLHALH